MKRATSKQAMGNKGLDSCDVISEETRISYINYEYLALRIMVKRSLDLCEDNDHANEI